MAKLIDLNGKTFGRLTVIERAENNKNGSARWLCKCSCGNTKIIQSCHLTRGKVKSCGCYNSDFSKLNHTKHGKSNTRIYRIWKAMKDRCYREKNIAFRNYGGRGIKVCDEWYHDFETFCEWAMSNGYSNELTIDRIDVNGNYEPSNCRWITLKEQSNNTRTNHRLVYKGVSKNISQWADALNIKRATLQRRIDLGWSIERALTTPKKRNVDK